MIYEKPSFRTQSLVGFLVSEEKFESIWEDSVTNNPDHFPLPLSDDSIFFSQ